MFLVFCFYVVRHLHCRVVGALEVEIRFLGLK